MVVSLIATVLDEADTLRGFLDGLLSQTRVPDEIVITDGGSTDGTVAMIGEYIEKGAPVRLIQAAGANIARGRNLAIAQARGEIIACTDAGCRADPGWLAELVAPFNSPETEATGGASRSDARNRIEESFGILLLPPDSGAAGAVPPGPSSRCVAFRRSLWEKVRGYPEELTCAEDSLFNRRVVQAGSRFVFCPKAVVFWRPPSSLRAAARKVFRYGLGDGRARLHREVYLRILVKAALVLCLAVPGLKFPEFFAVLVLSAAAYYLRMLQVNRHRGSLRTISLVFIHRLVLDPAKLIGYLFGRFLGRRVS
jgi:glycosyltransferase involved in cell wall biosynthesis